MTEPKWTPGPWTVDRPSDQNQRMHVVREFNWRLVASMENCNKFLAYAEETRANANLISAAPDLYTATDWANGLIPLLEVSEDKEITFVQIQLSSDAIRALIDARRKARGE